MQCCGRLPWTGELSTQSHQASSRSPGPCSCSRCNSLLLPPPSPGWAPAHLCHGADLREVPGAAGVTQGAHEELAPAAADLLPGGDSEAVAFRGAHPTHLCRLSLCPVLGLQLALGVQGGERSSAPPQEQVLKRQLQPAGGVPGQPASPASQDRTGQASEGPQRPGKAHPQAALQQLVLRDRLLLNPEAPFSYRGEAIWEWPWRRWPQGMPTTAAPQAPRPRAREATSPALFACSPGKALALCPEGGLLAAPPPLHSRWQVGSHGKETGQEDKGAHGRSREEPCSVEACKRRLTAGLWGATPGTPPWQLTLDLPFHFPLLCPLEAEQGLSPGTSSVQRDGTPFRPTRREGPAWPNTPFQPSLPHR